MLYNIIFAMASLVMGIIFGLPGAACVAVIGGTIEFSIVWWAIALVEIFVMACIELYWSIKEGA